MFTHLHVHSHYSILDGMSKVPDIVDKCLRTGMNAVALTDHGNMYGIKELLDYCKKTNGKLKEKAEKEGTTFTPFKPIVGCEAYCARRGRRSKTQEEGLTAEGKRLIIDRSGWHLILLAKNIQGYRNLCRMVSMSFMEDAFNYTPRIDKELLEECHEGVICCSACLGGELPQKIMQGLAHGERVDQLENGAFEEAQETVRWFKTLFGDDYYIEMQRHQTDKPGGDRHVFEMQREVNPVLLALARKFDVKIIASNDAHFVEEEHAEAHDRLICLSTNHYVDDANRMHYTKQEWLKTPQEMAAVFSDLPEALQNTQEIADKVEVYDIDSDPIMPKFPIPEEFGTEEQYREKFTEQQLFEEFSRNERGEVVMDEKEAKKKIAKLGGYDRLYRIKLEADYLEHLTRKGAVERYGEERLQNDETLQERIRFELHVMKTMGFPGYFLIVMDFIRAAREELNVSVGPGRGSAAGSVVAYCLHITDLDPLKYDLLFERFLNPDRISLPDIDTDFDDEGRARVLDYVSRKYGDTHVAHIVTYGAMAAKSAIDDICRVQRIPLTRAKAIKALIPASFPDNVKDEKGKNPEVNIRNCCKYVDELRQIARSGDANEQQMLTYAGELEGTIRQVGIHACGVIIGADDLTKFVPLSSVEDKELGKRVLVTEYDGHVVESVGLIKMDFLGLKTLTIIREALKNIKRARGLDIDIDHIPIDDPDTYRLFQEGRTVGVFQFESGGMQKYMKELKPTVMGDLIAMNALYRPGPMQYIPQFIRRKQGLEPVTYDLPVMERYLKDTYGVTVYQEQVMLLSRLLAGFTRGESDKLRKAMGKKQKATLEELKGKFMEGGKANGHDEKTLKKIWSDWEAFASYAFNKSHAACYSWIAYQTAFLKARYPAEFMAANLTVSKDDIKEVTKFMDECKSMRIGVLEPDVNESELNFTVNKDGNIRFGLGGIKGVGESAVEAIIEERTKNGRYKSIFDFLERVNLQACNRKTVESLAQAGAFDCFTDIYREQILGVNDKGESVLDTLMRYGNTFQQDRQMQQNSLFGDMGGMVEIQKPDLPQVQRMSPLERLSIEKNMIGIFLSAHPLDEYRFEVEQLCNITAAELQRFDGWRTPSERAQAIVADNSQTGEDTTADETKNDPSAWIRQRENQPLHFGGIVTKAEEAVSQKGNPYGRYTVEDYSGTYRLTLFGDAYKQYAPMLKPNMYVYLTGVIQQRGAGRSFFKPKPFNEAEFEFVVQQVELLQEAQAKHMQRLMLLINVPDFSQAHVEGLQDLVTANPGNIQMQTVLLTPEMHHQIVLTSQKSIHISKSFYTELLKMKNDGVLRGILVK